MDHPDHSRMFIVGGNLFNYEQVAAIRFASGRAIIDGVQKGELAHWNQWIKIDRSVAAIKAWVKAGCPFPAEDDPARMSPLNIESWHEARKKAAK